MTSPVPTPTPAASPPILGVGVDVCSIARISAALSHHGAALAQRVCTPHELAEKPALATNPAALARRWALKEAVSKALGTGIGQGQISFHSIKISYNLHGQPQVSVQGREAHAFHASVSDDADVVMACCIVTPCQ